ncbi:metallophosphoesterase family protein [Corynebacterium alimapuense]|uniref:Nuclease SbcCD subunit D n=1 Tax=Corynebacterium alimapuense TaxID=1576874 RepID=A0A3M8K7D5_9CORY|nr:metallophosphoesterase [Corynebacterium alimapuense]RNE48424.1 DNA repair exonuclease [Corynebacterium alimapuense]
MTSISFLHTSDLQLGMTRWFLDDEAQGRFDDARLRSIDRLGQIAQARDCAFIVIAGDVFEHNSLSQRVTGRVKERLRALPVPVFLLPGNHDPLVADSIFYQARDIAGVHILGDSTPVAVSEGVEIVGAPLLSKHATTDLVRQALEPLEPTADIRILVGHGQAEARSNEHHPDLIDLSYVEQALAAGTVDYLALGDTHSARPVGNSGRVWFSGAPETTDFHDLAAGDTGGEDNSGNALIVTVTKTATLDATVEVDEVAVGEWVFEAIDRELGSAEDVAEFLTALEAYPHKDRTVIKYSLRGTLDIAATRTLEKGLETHRPVFAALFERERLNDLHLEPDEQELADLGIGGYPAAALAELAQQAETDPTARDAVNLFFRLAKEA